MFFQMSPRHDRSSIFVRRRAAYLKLIKMANDEWALPSVCEEMISFTDNLKHLFISQYRSTVKYFDDDLLES
jgi:hypothetical protein